MPGLENGSSQANAFTWDHTQYPGGTRVFGATSYNQSEDWWAVYLQAGKTYVFQTRSPTNFYAYLYLYDSNGSYVAGYSGYGDDGYPRTRLTFTPQYDGMYYFTLYGYSYYGEYGPYVLEVIPAPRSLRVLNIASCRHSARSTATAAVTSKFNIIRERTEAAHATRYTIHARATRSNGSRFSPRSMRLRQNVARFSTNKTATVLIVPGSFSARAPADASNISQFDARSPQQLIVPDRWHKRSLASANVNSIFTIRSNTAVDSVARHQALTLPGWTIWARDTATGQFTRLGFMSADDPAPQLTDVPLPPGIFEIEVRPSEWLWPECRGRQVITLITGDGPSDPPAGLPVIQNLRREIVGGISIIKWNIAAEAVPEAFDFGVWFGSASPVDTSGPPNQVVPYYSAQGAYQIFREQTASEAVAVAAFTSTSCGKVAQFDLPWDMSSPISPPDQFGR